MEHQERNRRDNQLHKGDRLIIAGIKTMVCKKQHELFVYNNRNRDVNLRGAAQ